MFKFGIKVGSHSHVSTAGVPPLRLHVQALELSSCRVRFAGLGPVTAGDLCHSPLLQLGKSLVRMVVFAAEAAWLCDPALVQVFGFSPQQCSLSALLSLLTLVLGCFEVILLKALVVRRWLLTLRNGSAKLQDLLTCCGQWDAAFRYSDPGPCRSQSFCIPLSLPLQDFLAEILSPQQLLWGRACAQHTFPFPCKQ